MAVNTQELKLGKLTIKYSPDYPIGSSEVEKLKVGLEVAKRAVAKTVNELLRLRYPVKNYPHPILGVHRSPELVGALQRQRNNDYFMKLDESNPLHFMSLAYHFALPTDADCAREWSQNISTITKNYSKILTGLQGNISIADAYSTIVAKGVTHKTASDISGTVYMKKSFQKNLTIDQKDYISSKEILLRPEGGDLVPYIDVKPDQYGSIHINFQMLKRPDISELRVARTIIHEASHKFCNTDDFAYAPIGDKSKTDRVIKMKYEQQYRWNMVWNADSYGYCAICLYKGEYIESNSQMPVD